jgi:hypothetical protein
MAFEELKTDLSDTREAAREYLESSAEYYKLRTFKFVMRATIALVVVLFVGMLGSLAVLFLSIAASIEIGGHFNNYTYGFLIVGGLYLVLGIIGYALRGRLEAPVLRQFSRYYFEDKQ